MAPLARRRRDGTASGPRDRAPLVLAGRAFVRGRLQPIEIAVDESGRIASYGRTRRGDRRHDVGDRVILPAATDLHVHFRDPPGAADTESIPNGTAQAALGGVTLIADMPNTHPVVDSVEALRDKEDRVRGRAAVDVLLYAAATRPAAIGSLARRAGAFKLFLSPTTGIDRPPGPESLEGLLAAVARTGLPLSVHAEDPALFGATDTAQDPRGWNALRPLEAESAAVDALLRAAPPGLRLHIAHVTSAAIAERVRQAGASFEVTPHHLLLSDRSGSDSRFKVNPPLRDETTRAALWASFRNGGVPCVASDHAPHPADRKGWPFPLAPSGMPGTETMLPLLLARVRAGELPIEHVVSGLCDRPARWLGQAQGRIAPGHKASFVVVDFRNRRTLTAGSLHAPVGWTAFEGWEIVPPHEVWRNGERIVSAGEFVGRADGTVVRPEFAPGEGAAERASD